MARRTIALILAAALVCAPAAGQIRSAQPQAALPQPSALALLRREVEIGQILADLAAAHPARDTLFRNVRIVDPAAAQVRPGQSVIVSGGRIVWIGDTGTEPAGLSASVIEGNGRFLAPGLADMHVHSETAADWLLNVATGVTTVREMGGFPWLLRARDAAQHDRLLAPTSYVAGPIINAFPLGGYAVTPGDQLTARSLVRRQAACGYDFVKIHNVLPLPLLTAVAEQARAEQMDVIGHVPHGIPVRQALELGLRTQEHLKGYLDDRTLRIGDTDHASAAIPDRWITPTIYAYRYHDSDEARAAMLAEPEMRYARPERRDSWQRLRQETGETAWQLNVQARQLRRQILTSLLPHRPRILAGTDGANYPFQVMGFALLRELDLLREAGLTPAAALRAATTEPAAAMRAEGAFGQIVRRARADLVLLNSDPIADPGGAYRRRAGVMLRGRWLEARVLDAMLERLAAIYARPAGETVDAAATAAMLRILVAEGFVLNSRLVRSAADELRAAGNAGLADELLQIQPEPQTGPCAMTMR